MKNIFTMVLLLLGLTMAAQVELKSVKFTNEDQCNGSAVIKLKPSEGPFVITLSGPVNSEQTTSLELLSFPQLCEGEYNVSVKDNHGCVSTLFFEVEVCEFLGTDVFFTLQPGCEMGMDGTVIGLNIFPVGEYYYKWSTGAETDHIFASTFDTYYVTVTDVNGCNHVTSKDFEVLQTDYEVYSSESSSVFQCSGKIAVNAEGIGNPFLLKLYDSDEVLLYETTIDEFAEGLFEFPVDVCQGDYEVEIINAVDCSKALPVSVWGGECDFSFHLDNVNFADGGEGSFEVIINGEVTSPEGYLFEFYAYSAKYPANDFCDNSDVINSEWHTSGTTGIHYFDGQIPSRWILLQGQMGNPVFSYPPPPVDCLEAYRMDVTSIYDASCKESIYLWFHPCEELNANETHVNVIATINSQISYPELGSITVSYESENHPHGIWNHHGLTTDAEMIGPNGETYTEYEYEFDWYFQGGFGHLGDKAYVTFSGMTEPGEYCITLSNNCGQSDEVCITLEECNSVMSFNTIENFYGSDNYPTLFPINRAKPGNLSDYENAYVGNGRCIDIADCYSEEDEYISDCTDPEEEKTLFFYEPYDQSSPCSGGIVSLYQYDYTGYPLRSVELIEQFEFTAEAAHMFEWQNNQDEYQPGQYEKATDYSYSGFNKEVFEIYGFTQNNNFIGNQLICESGAFCLFESQDLFENIFTDQFILLTSCTNWTSICNVWPESSGCNDINCNNITCPWFEFVCEGACPSCEDGIQNQGEEDVDCGGSNCEPCSDCYNGITDGNETWSDCGPTCPCLDKCGDGIQNECETGVDCGGPCCPPCNSTGDPGSEYECINDWDCDQIGYECINGECVPIECDPEDFISDCNIGETCLEGIGCVILCEDSFFDCPIGYICGPDGFCIEDDDIEPTDDCFPECEEPDYECVNGNCIYVGVQINDCSFSNPCPTGQYCDNGDCTNCPVITYDPTYGNNQDCQFEIFIYSDHYILANIKVYRSTGSNTILLNDYNLAFSSWNPLELSYQVPDDCLPYYFSFEITFEDCSINTIEIGPYDCTGNCRVSNNSDDNSIVNNGEGIESEVANSEKQTKNDQDVTTTQGLVNSGIKCYPNPTGGFVNLYSTNLLLDRVEIYNVVGQKQIDLFFDKQDHLQKLDISQLTSGIYFLRVYDISQKFQLIKIVKN